MPIDTHINKEGLVKYLKLLRSKLENTGISKSDTLKIFAKCTVTSVRAAVLTFPFYRNEMTRGDFCEN